MVFRALEISELIFLSRKFLLFRFYLKRQNIRAVNIISAACENYVAYLIAACNKWQRIFWQTSPLYACAVCFQEGRGRDGGEGQMKPVVTS